jgi:hypothetical protein
VNHTHIDKRKGINVALTMPASKLLRQIYLLFGKLDKFVALMTAEVYLLKIGHSLKLRADLMQLRRLNPLLL